MKGLMIKDFFCLRKGLKTYILVTVGMIVIAIMFLLSSQYGNVAAAQADLRLENPDQADLLEQLFKIVICFMLLLPIAFLGNLTDCFKEDTRAGFRKTLSGMPLSPWQIVGSRYLTCLIFGSISMAVSAVAAVIIASVSDSYRLSRLLLLVLTFGAVFLVYVSAIMFFVYIFGARRADLIQICPLVILFLAVMVSFTSRTGTMADEELTEYMTQLGPNLRNMLEQRYPVLLLISVVCVALSYLGSVAVIKYRKEVR